MKSRIKALGQHFTHVYYGSNFQFSTCFPIVFLFFSLTILQLDTSWSAYWDIYQLSRSIYNRSSVAYCVSIVCDTKWYDHESDLLQQLMVRNKSLIYTSKKEPLIIVQILQKFTIKIITKESKKYNIFFLTGFFTNISLWHAGKIILIQRRPKTDKNCTRGKKQQKLETQICRLDVNLYWVC